MDNPGLSEPLWRALDRRLWHATGPDCLDGILGDGEVAIVCDRYRNSLCRSLDCVALFDFGPTAVDTAASLGTGAAGLAISRRLVSSSGLRSIVSPGRRTSWKPEECARYGTTAIFVSSTFPA